MTKRKPDYLHREGELAGEKGGVGEGLFEELMESVREAGAILRGEREAVRITRFEDAGDVTIVVPGGSGAADSSGGGL